jgi:hypothetical protein
MHGKSDLKLSIQKIFPSTWPPNRPDLHPALYPSALALSKNVPQIPLRTNTPQFLRQSYAILHLHGSAGLYPLDSCTRQLLLSIMHQQYTIKSLLFMLLSSSCRSNPDGRLRPTYKALSPLGLYSQLRTSLCYADFRDGVYLANRRQLLMLMPRKTKVRSMHRKENIRLCCNCCSQEDPSPLSTA